VGKVIILPNLHLLKTSRCNFGGQNNHAAKNSSTQFTWKKVDVTGGLTIGVDFF
jgi:hypothetical protein